MKKYKGPSYSIILDMGQEVRSWGGARELEDGAKTTTTRMTCVKVLIQSGKTQHDAEASLEQAEGEQRHQAAAGGGAAARRRRAAPPPPVSLRTQVMGRRWKTEQKLLRRECQGAEAKAADSGGR
jgi:hypothetical protein